MKKSNRQKDAGGKITVGLIQMRCGADAADNLRRALAHIKEAARAGARIVCLQELFRTPYFCQSENDAMFALASFLANAKKFRCRFGHACQAGKSVAHKFVSDCDIFSALLHHSHSARSFCQKN